MASLDKNKSIPNFSYKSGLLILGSAILGSVILPSFLNKLGINIKILQALISGLVIAYGTSYAHFMIENKEGHTSRFYKVFSALFVILSLLFYFLEI